jgi:phage gpG-like protein
MAVVIRGDFDRLSGLIAQVRSIASPRFQAELREGLARAAEAEIVSGFDRSADPYGNRWEPLKAERGRRAGGQPLVDTGKLRSSYAARPSATGFDVQSRTSYAGYHQYGTKRIPARPMVPNRRDDLGPYWRRSFIRVIEDKLARATRR